MKHLFIFTVFLSVLACNNSKTKSPESSIDAIKTLESNSSLSKSDTLINSYINFAAQFPDHRLAPKFMFKAASAFVGSNRALKGVRLYEEMATKYPDDSLAPEAIICAGVGFEGLHDPANAKRLYDLFIQKYPQHPRVGEVRKWSEFVGLSEEELLRRFQEDLQKKDSAKLQ